MKAELQVPSLNRCVVNHQGSTLCPKILPTGRLVARNATVNLLGECLSGIIGLLSIPVVIRGMGTEAFGILSLGWVLLSYFTLFDVGLARATTKLASEALGRGENERLPSIVGTTLVCQSALGVLGAVCMAACVPTLVNGILKISASLKSEAAESFWILCALVPIVLASNSLRGILEALQRFDLTNWVKIPTTASMFLLPIVLLRFGFHLPGIVLSIAFFRVGALIAYIFLYLRSCAPARPAFGFEFPMIRSLFTYGGWVTISNLTGPILIYADRFMLGSLLSMAAVTYYAAPADMINRFLIFPASLSATLFPALSSFDGAGMKLKLDEFYSRSLKCTILVLGPPLAILFLFSGRLLHAWLGAEFASRSTMALQIMAVAVFVNAIGYFPFILLQGANRPNVTGIFHLVELPIQIGLVWFLVKRFGITGAASASALRLLLDTGLLFYACWRLRVVSRGALTEHGVLRSLYFTIFLFVAVGTLRIMASMFVLQIGLAVVTVTAYLLACWYLLLDSEDHGFVRETWRRLPFVPVSTQNYSDAILDGQEP
jgi:O-antigen/teichoic acid export membrane protein